MIPWVTHTVSIKRLTQSITSGKRSVSESTVATDVDIYLSPEATTESESILGVKPDEGWLGFFPFGTDLQSLDEITDGTTTWRCYSVRAFPQFGVPVQATLEEKS